MNAEAQLAALRAAVAAVGAGESSKVIYKGASFTKLLTFFADNSKRVVRHNELEQWIICPGVIRQ